LTGELLNELLALVREANAVLEPSELLPTIARQVRRLIDFRILEIYLTEDDGTSLSLHHSEGYCRTEGVRVAPGEGVVGAAAQLREPVFVPDVTRDPRHVSIAPDIRAELALPLLHRGRLVGVLNIEGTDAGAFTQDARTALRVLANHLAVAIENATLYRETRHSSELLATLYAVGQETASILDLDELLHRVAELVKHVIDYEMFGILLLDAEAGELVLRKAVSFGEYGEKTRIKLGQGLCGTAATTKKPVRVDDVLADPRYVRLVPQTRSELVIPLIHKDKVVGVFDLESSELGRFTEEHVKVLTPLASQVAAAIENAHLYDELRTKDERLEKELHIARGIQRALFPEACPRGRRWQASAHFLPARELGGDLYDFYELSEDTLGVAVGDVSGKGVPAALYGAFTSGAVRAQAFGGRHPADLLARVNRTLRRRGVEALFCTLVYALFDFDAMSLTAAGSGLPYPLHYRASSGRCTLLDVAGLPLGAFDESRYEECSVAIATGDIIVFHSDGVSEAYNGHENYGMQRLTRQVEAGGQLAPAELGKRLTQDLHAFMGTAENNDDVTLVVVRVE